MSTSFSPTRPIATIKSTTIRAMPEDLSSAGRAICAARMRTIIRNTRPELMPISTQFFFTRVLCILP